MNVTQELGKWFDLFAEAFQDPVPHFPARRLALELGSSLNARSVSFNWAGPAGGRWVRHWPPVVPQPILDTFVHGSALFQDPLVDWFERSQSLAPQTAGRLPDGGRSGPSTGPDFRFWLDLMQYFGIEQRLCIPLRLGPREHLAFVLAREGEDFSEQELALAGRLRPMLSALQRQTDVLQALRTGRAAAEEGGLTGRELSVLVLLQRGLTAAAIGHRLEISERTVHKHLEHAYRKLGVRDRLSAVVLARDLGWLPTQPPGRPGRPGQAILVGAQAGA